MFDISLVTGLPTKDETSKTTVQNSFSLFLAFICPAVANLFLSLSNYQIYIPKNIF